MKMAVKQVPQELLTRSFSVTVDRPDGVNENEERETKGLLLGFVDFKASRDPNLSATHSHLLSDALSQVDSDCESDTRRPVVESTDAAAVRIGRELAEIADDMDQRAEENLEGLFSDFLPVLGSPSLAYQLFLNTAKRTFEWNESGVGECCEWIRSPFVCNGCRHKCLSSTYVSRDCSNARFAGVTVGMRGWCCVCVCVHVYVCMPVSVYTHVSQVEKSDH